MTNIDNPFLNLPNEIHLEFISHLPLADYLSYSESCKGCHELASGPLVWKKVAKQAAERLGLPKIRTRNRVIARVKANEQFIKKYDLQIPPGTTAEEKNYVVQTHLLTHPTRFRKKFAKAILLNDNYREYGNESSEQHKNEVTDKANSLEILLNIGVPKILKLVKFQDLCRWDHGSFFFFHFINNTHKETARALFKLLKSLKPGDAKDNIDWEISAVFNRNIAMKNFLEIIKPNEQRLNTLFCECNGIYRRKEILPLLMKAGLKIHEQHLNTLITDSRFEQDPEEINFKLKFFCDRLQPGMLSAEELFQLHFFRTEEYLPVLLKAGLQMKASHLKTLFTDLKGCKASEVDFFKKTIRSIKLSKDGLEEMEAFLASIFVHYAQFREVRVNFDWLIEVIKNVQVDRSTIKLLMRILNNSNFGARENTILLELIKKFATQKVRPDECHLKQAVQIQNLDLMKFFLDSGVKPNGKHLKRAIKNIFYCDKDKAYKTVLLLLDAGAVPDASHIKALITSFRFERNIVQFLKMFIAAGAKPDDTHVKRAIKADLSSGQDDHRLAFITELLDGGALVNSTHLKWAAERKLKSLVILLIARGAEVELETRQLILTNFHDGAQLLKTGQIKK